MSPSDAELHAALQGRLERDLHTLPDKPEEDARSALHALWHLAAGRALSATAAMEHALPSLDDPARLRLQALVDQRLAGTPLAHLTGRQRFMGLEMLSGPQALIPRRESELLARAAVDVLQSMAHQGRRPLVLDVCTGSANIAAVLASTTTPAQIHAADLSPDALVLAAQNLSHLGLSERVDLRCGDLLAPFDEPAFLGQVDLITCNPPYISAARRETMDPEIRGHEPELAFDGGPLGVRILNRLVKETPRWLRDGGWLAIEVGAGQGPAVMHRLSASGQFPLIEQRPDASGELRVLLAQHSVTS
ncbi:MAG TPA: peptide chain release factor N(5)-glutamine methyltransferase [Burkholderiaceae bacterium]|jgi:release factor glutamine methyltransferase|nr:peptide chain release factor N(5)-glutamine methyltransferase [Burkholderiaceae bacterium]